VTASPRPSSAVPRRPRPAGPTRLLVVAGVLVVGLVGTWLTQVWLAANAAAGERSKLLAAIDAEVGKPAPDAGELSRLTAALHKQPDHETARELVVAAARIELARDHADRAWRLVAPFAGAPGASASDRLFGAQVLLRCHEGGGSDRNEESAWLRQALALAQGAQAELDLPEAALCAWQAAARLGDSAAAEAMAAALRDRHGGSLEARVVALAGSFDPAAPRGDLDALVAEMAPPLPELSAMQVLASLQQGEMAAAVASAEATLARAPGVLVVRLAACVVFHACVAGHAADAAHRAPWVARRDVQLDWLLDRAPAEDPRRQAWGSMRDLR
jgi:hypothetical protein